MNPSEYGMSTHSAETYIAIAVEDLLMKVDKSTLHIVGTPSKEYLGMLSLYAIARCKMIFPADKGFGKLITLASETFDPFNMSESLIRRLTDLLAAEKVRYFSHP